MKFLVIGHYTPTDADADEAVQGKLDDGVTVTLCDNRAEAENALLWWQDGVIVEAP
jgi:hypothetical protein